MKSKRNVPLLLVMIASFIIFIFAAGKLIEIYLEYKKGNHTYEELMEYVQEPEADEHGKNDPDPEDESGFTFLQVDFEEIKAQNPDVAAWIPRLRISLLHTYWRRFEEPDRIIYERCCGLAGMKCQQRICQWKKWAFQ